MIAERVWTRLRISAPAPEHTAILTRAVAPLLRAYDRAYFVPDPDDASISVYISTQADEDMQALRAGLLGAVVQLVTAAIKTGNLPFALGVARRAWRIADAAGDTASARDARLSIRALQILIADIDPVGAANVDSPVRRAIARDLDRVKAVGTTDVSTLTIRLDEVIQPVLADLASALARFEGYGERFAAARRLVEAGERDWFTRPLIDSYHTIWFELHEDLLATLGLERSHEHRS